MSYQLSDIIVVSIIGLIAIGFLVRLVRRMMKNKAASLCNGCSTGTCSTKNFSNDKQVIKFHKPQH